MGSSAQCERKVWAGSAGEGPGGGTVLCRGSAVPSAPPLWAPRKRFCPSDEEPILLECGENLGKECYSTLQGGVAAQGGCCPIGPAR